MQLIQDRADEISKEALNKETPPNGYSLLEIHLFLVTKEIYKQYFNGRIGKETGVKLKSLAIAEFNQRAKIYNLEQEINNKTISCIRKTEALRRKLRHELNDKDKNALNTALELVGLYSGELSVWKGEFDEQ